MQDLRAGQRQDLEPTRCVLAIDLGSGGGEGCHRGRHRRSCRLAGLDKEKFPTLVPNDGIIGPLLPSVAEKLGLQASTPVVAGIADSNASAINYLIYPCHPCPL
jgi:sugar (pentulose or hexulose) kinase